MAIKNIMREYGYQDVYLKPAKTIVISRKDCDTSIIFGGHKFVMPVYPANMKSVVNINTCIYMASHGWFYTMHRFDIDLVRFVSTMQDANLIASISVGINDEAIKQLEQLLVAGLTPEFITIDIANAWCVQINHIVEYIKKYFPKSFLIVGNVATVSAVEELHQLGIDAIKVGIAGGRVCITKNKTGFHRPMMSTVLECAQYTRQHNLPLIADGGIVEHGDIAKAIAGGANMVMAGSLFAGYDQSAGDVIEITTNDSSSRAYKEYYGSASQYNKGEYRNVEGKKILIDYRGNMEKLLIELKEDLQSSISYAGGSQLADLSNAEIIIIN